MNLFLYIQITDVQEDVKFCNPFISRLRENNLDIVTYDVDNHSEPFIIGYANRLILDSDKKIVLFDTELNSNFSRLMPFLTNLLDKSDGIEIFIRGNNQKLEKVISAFTYFKVPETTHENAIIELIMNKFL